MGLVTALIVQMRFRRARFRRTVVRAQIVDLLRTEFGEAGAHLRAIEGVDPWARAGLRADELLPADADDVIASGTKQFREVVPILPGASDNQRDLGNVSTSELGPETR